MKCPCCIAYLEQYASRPDSEWPVDVLSHLNTCRRCRKYADDMRASHRALSLETHPDSPAPADLTERLQRALHAENASPERSEEKVNSRHWSGFTRIAVPCAAAVVFVFLAARFFFPALGGFTDKVSLSARDGNLSSQEMCDATADSALPEGDAAGGSPDLYRASPTICANNADPTALKRTYAGNAIEIVTSNALPEPNALTEVSSQLGLTYMLSDDQLLLSGSKEELVSFFRAMSWSDAESFLAGDRDADENLESLTVRVRFTTQEP